MALTPTTELEAVNLMLSVIGESPVNSVTSSGVADAALAYNLLQQASREAQIVGWNWNTEDEYTLSPNEAGEIVLPANTLKVDTVTDDIDLDLVQRGFKLYDRKNHTYIIDRAVKVEIVLLLEFEELPEAARHYITIRASRRFQQAVVGSEVLDAYTREDEFKAMAYLKEAEAESGDYNMIYGSWSTYRVLDR